MKALILAAGQGTRLMPLTADRPKCLVEFLGRSLLERNVESLRRAGIDDIVVVAGYRAEMIERLGLRVALNSRFATTNMVTTLFSAEHEFPDGEDLFICYGDIVYEPKALEALMETDAEVGVAVNTAWRTLWERRFDDPLSDAETLRIGPDGQLLEIGRKPTSYDQIEAQYMGLIRVRADQVARLRQLYADMDRDRRYDGKDFDNMYMTSFVQYLVDAGWDVRAVPVNGGWLEIDSVDDLETYEAWARDGELDSHYKI